MKALRNLSPNERGMLILIVLLLIGILVRWAYIKPSAKQGIDKYLNPTEENNK